MDTRVSKQTRELIPGHPSCLAWSTNVFGLHMPAVLGWQIAKFLARSSSGRCSETVYSLMEYRRAGILAPSLQTWPRQISAISYPGSWQPVSGSENVSRPCDDRKVSQDGSHFILSMLYKGHPSCLAWSTNVVGLHMPAEVGWQKAKISAQLGKMERDSLLVHGISAKFADAPCARRQSRSISPNCAEIFTISYPWSWQPVSGTENVSRPCDDRKVSQDGSHFILSMLYVFFVIYALLLGIIVPLKCDPIFVISSTSYKY